jgi:hypothetical protein
MSAPRALTEARIVLNNRRDYSRAPKLKPSALGQACQLDEGRRAACPRAVAIREQLAASIGSNGHS